MMLSYTTFDSNSPGEKIGLIVEQLCKVGATLISIPCNTAHSPEIFKAITKYTSSECRILNLIDETINELVSTKPSLRRVGILSTEGARLSGIYCNPLREQGIEVIETDDDFQRDFVNPFIYHPARGIKSKAIIDKTLVKDPLGVLIENLLSKGAEAVIMGCTELDLALEVLEVYRSQTISPLTTLAKATVREWATLRASSST